MADLTGTILDLTQTFVAIMAMFTAVRGMILSSKLNAAATLFNYYNAKISSLRKSIIRDSGDRQRAQLQSLEEREVRLKALLEAHEQMRGELEALYQKSPYGY